MNKSVNTVVVSRYWHHPEITVSLNEDGIAIEISLDDFCRALANEIGADPKAAVDAKNVVLSKIKGASIHA